MKKKRQKTDFTEQDERQRQFRAYLSRKEELRQQRLREAAEPKR